MEQRYLSLNDTADYTGLSRQTLYVWAEEGKIPAYKVGRIWRFDKQEVDDFIKKRPVSCYNKALVGTGEGEERK